MTSAQPTLLFARFLSVAVLAATVASGSASAETLFSQRVPNPWVEDTAYGSDRDAFFGRLAQSADDLTLASPATVRSVTWWGIFKNNDVPTGPVSFDVVFYADAGNLPNAGAILSYTNVTFSTLTDTGEQFGGDGSRDVYVFQADVPPTPLPGGTQVWFSVLADSGSPDDGSFLWRADNGIRAAQRIDDDSPATPFEAAPALDFSFVLEGEPVPEPGTMATALLGLGTLLAVRRRRNG